MFDDDENVHESSDILPATNEDFEYVLQMSR